MPCSEPFTLPRDAFAAGGVGHRVRLVEDDHAVEVVAGPGEDLLEPGRIGAARAQRRIGDEQDAVAHPDRGAELPRDERLDVDRQAAERRPVAARIFEQGLVLGDPDVAAFAAHPSVEDDARDLPALAGAGAVAEKVALPIGRALAPGLERAALVLGLEAAGQVAG